MIDITLQDKCRILIDSKIAERRKILVVEIRKIDNIDAIDFVSDRFYQLICSEFKTRSTIVWQGMVKAHKISGSIHKKTLKDDFKQEFYNYIREAYLELAFKLQSLTQNTTSTTEYKLDDIQAQIIEKYSVEIDVYVDSLTIPQNYTAED